MINCRFLPKRAILAILIACVVSSLAPNHSQAQVTAKEPTVGSIIQGLQDLARQLENGAQTLLQQGNSAIAQQQMIAAGLIRSLANQMSEIYKNNLNETAIKLSIFESNLKDDVIKILAQVQDIERGLATDVQKSIYQLQGSVNQLINRIPISDRNPIFYGMLVYDVSSAFPSKGFDIELLGFNLTDPERDSKAPKIVVGGETIPTDKVSVQEDRVQVVLPQSVKEKIGFRGDFCSAPVPFTVNMTSYSRTNKRFIIIPGKDTETTFNAFALSEPDTVMAKVTYAGILRTTSNRTESFSQRGSYTSVGCEENNSSSVVTNLPDNVTEVKCHAAWIDQSNLQSQSATCAIGGSTVTASGTMRGLNKQCIDLGFIRVCNCPGGGHGALELTGTYKVTEAVTSAFYDNSIPPNRFLNNFDSTIPSDSAREVKSIDIELTRPRCAEPLDTISLKVHPDPIADTTQASQNGLFKATYRNLRLTIERTR